MTVAPVQAAVPAPAAVTAYSFTSAEGDPVGGGRSATYRAPADTITLRAGQDDPDALWVSVFHEGEEWDIHLAPPRGEKLRPGVYRDAENAGTRTGRAPGLDVRQTGTTCQEVYGTFTVHQIERDASGAVTLLEANFNQSCEAADAPALRGNVRYHAYPLSYRYDSDPEEWIGQGLSKTLTGATSTFGLTGSVQSGVTFTASGRRDSWKVILAAPQGESLTVGRTYQATWRGTLGAAKLDVTNDPRGCTVGGEFTVTRLAADDSGRVTALAATFTHDCNGPKLRGTLHYYA
ncbi:hypothetical protein [Streptomyces sp. Wb2n-11]|uniref:hypothetical protein n=1 Tax=Streptomyces sp. Wb2n-11 TaxID=1030533 RepID=UPI0011464947|nr:hypothetical protein [Streptomyces sp. Wb2n-11]